MRVSTFNRLALRAPVKGTDVADKDLAARQLGCYAARDDLAPESRSFDGRIEPTKGAQEKSRGDRDPSNPAAKLRIEQTDTN